MNALELRLNELEARLAALEAERQVFPVCRREPAVVARRAIKIAAEHLGVPAASVMARNREAPVAWTRQVSMYLTRKISDATTIAIGREFQREHGCVVNAVKAVTNRMETEPGVRAQIEFLTVRLRAIFDGKGEKE